MFISHSLHNEKQVAQDQTVIKQQSQDLDVSTEFLSLGSYLLHCSASFSNMA